MSTKEDLLAEFKKEHEKYLDSIRSLDETETDAIVESQKRFDEMVIAFQKGEVTEQDLRTNIQNIQTATKEHLEMPRGLCSYACLEDLYNGFAVVVATLVKRDFPADAAERASNMYARKIRELTVFMLREMEKTGPKHLSRDPVHKKIQELTDELVALFNILSKADTRTSMEEFFKILNKEKKEEDSFLN